MTEFVLWESKFILQSTYAWNFDISFRREIIQYALRLLIDCFQTVLSHTYISVTLLMMYAAIWLLNIPFDTHLFAIAVCILSYMRLSVVDFSSLAVRHLAQYMAAEKRIQVSFCIFQYRLSCWGRFNTDISPAFGIWTRRSIIVPITIRACS